MRVFCCFIKKEILNYDEFHRRKGRRDVLRVGIRLSRVFTLDVNALEAAVKGRLEHVWQTQPGLMLERDAPGLLKEVPDRRIGHVSIAAELMGE